MWLSERNSPLWRFPLPLSFAHGILPLLSSFFLYFHVCESVCTHLCTRKWRPEVAIGNHPPLLSHLAHWGRIFQLSLQLTMAHVAHHLALGSLCLGLPRRWLWMGANIPTLHGCSFWDLNSGPMLAWWIISLNHLSSFIKYMWSWKSLKSSPNQFFTSKHFTFLRLLLGST